jgi:acyl-homoserine-lactone acylase
MRQDEPLKNVGATTRFASLCVVALVTFIAGSNLFGAPGPNDRDRKATIRRDTYGVPHILASTEQDAALAQGYAAAEDYLALMARLFLRARGELASVFGEKLVQEDLLVKTLGIWDEAEKRFEELPPFMQGILNSYAAGYNLYLAKRPPEAPDWARPVSGIDVLAHSRAIMLLDFALDLRPWKQATHLPSPGSNLWAIGGARSHSHRGILLANPHLGWEGSHLLQEVQLTVPGRIDVAGAAFVGSPVVSIGFNEHLGWSMTVNDHRYDDVYELTLDEAHPGKYLYDDEWLPLRSRVITIAVKTETGTISNQRTLQYSHYGPIIRIDGKKAYAYKSPNLHLVNFLTQYNLMAKARSFSEFYAALQMQQIPMFNIGYTDSEGNVFYVDNVRAPIRNGSVTSSRVLRGDSSANEWFTIYPLVKLPQLLNPLGGYIQNCNEAPWFANLEQPIERQKFLFITGENPGVRTMLSLRMIEQRPDMTIEIVKSCKCDDTMLVAERLKPDLVLLLKDRSSERPDFLRAANLLQGWDNRVSIDSKAATLFDSWWGTYQRTSSHLFKTEWDPAKPLQTPTGIGDPTTAIAAFERVAAALKSQYGTWEPVWGDIHRLKRGDVDIAIGGTHGTFRTIDYRRDLDGKMVAKSGDSYVLVVEFTDPPVAYSSVAYSGSSNPKSRHYSDQSALFAHCKYKQVWFTKSDIEQHLERSYQPGE